MLQTLAISGYRSLHDVVLPMGGLTVITGENGSGKSNLYKSLRLITAAAEGNIIRALAHEGGLPSTLWAGPENISPAMKQGTSPIQGGPRKTPVRLKLGFAAQPYSYFIELGMPVPAPRSLFNLDPVIKRECLFVGHAWRQAAVLIDRKGPLLRRRTNRRWETVSEHLPDHEALFAQAGDPRSVPEVFALLHSIQSWRFYDDFRTDREAPARRNWPATRTPVLASDGRDLAAALQTIREIGDERALNDAIHDAFPGSSLVIESIDDGKLELTFQQPGLLRTLKLSEWSDGTLQYVMLVAALLTPRPPPLLVLNEPESSLHPDLLPALARLIKNVSTDTQVWVITHANRLVNALNEFETTESLHLVKSFGQTGVHGLHDLDVPMWRWP